MHRLLRLYGKGSPLPAFIPPGHTAVQTPDCLLEPLVTQLVHLADLADATETHFACYYRPAIKRLGAFLQQLPAAPGEVTASLLEARLLTAAAALQRRRGYFLPPGAEPETLTLEADCWTYAVFTLSLIHGLGPELAGWQIELFDRRNRSLGVWKPWHGPMGEQDAFSYRAERTDSRSKADWTPLLSAYLMPRRGHEWLWANRAVLAVWLDTLNGSAGTTVIRDILSTGRQPDAPFSDCRR